MSWFFIQVSFASCIIIELLNSYHFLVISVNFWDMSLRKLCKSWKLSFAFRFLPTFITKVSKFVSCVSPKSCLVPILLIFVVVVFCFVFLVMAPWDPLILDFGSCLVHHLLCYRFTTCLWKCWTTCKSNVCLNLLCH